MLGVGLIGEHVRSERPADLRERPKAIEDALED
jgi:hypothetical protein